MAMYEASEEELETGGLIKAILHTSAGEDHLLFTVDKQRRRTDGIYIYDEIYIYDIKRELDKKIKRDEGNEKKKGNEKKRKADQKKKKMRLLLLCMRVLRSSLSLSVSKLRSVGVLEKK